ncbi:hypothetical protein RQP46_002372 [Phenoliferia psychrophenolica]
MNKGEPRNIINELHMTTNDYAWLSTIYTIPFVLAEIPSNLIMKKQTPRLHVTRIVGLWSIAACCHAAATNRAGLLVARFFLGLFEAGLYPGILAQLTYWYRPDELAVRMVVLGLLGSFSGILSAILAWGITFMNGAGGLSAWRYMFLFEGLLGLALAIVAFIWLPNLYSLCAGVCMIASFIGLTVVTNKPALYALTITATASNA